MTASASWAAKLTPRVAAEACHIADCFAAQGTRVDCVPAADGGIDYLYAEGHILVRSESLAAVAAVLLDDRFTSDAKFTAGPAATDRAVAAEFGARPIIAGVNLLPLHKFGVSVPDALSLIDARLGAGIATPDHVLTVAGEVTPCPATEPGVVYAGIEPDPGICRDNSGAGVLIYLADTGLLADADATHSWLRGVRRASDPGGVTQPPEPVGSPVVSGAPEIAPYAGHGTFVAGVVRCMASEADVIVSNAFNTAGSALESTVIPDLFDALGLGVDIFNLTISTPTRKDLPLIGFDAWLKLLRHYKGTVCVVAAGNSGSRRPSWPAAFAEVVSVGALAANLRDRADFSNHGGWVDVYAPGRNLINAYATGIYTCYAPPYAGEQRRFYGMAQWSGTSFSTPIVTGLIAARMFRTGENGQEAARSLLREARSQAIPGVGAILLPCGGPASHSPECSATRCCCQGQQGRCSC